MTDRTPRTWKFRSPELTLVVTRHIYYPADAWVLRCEPWFSQVPLRAKDIEDAQKEALSLVRTYLRKSLVQLENEIDR